MGRNLLAALDQLDVVHAVDGDELERRVADARLAIADLRVAIAVARAHLASLEADAAQVESVVMHAGVLVFQAHRALADERARAVETAMAIAEVADAVVERVAAPEQTVGELVDLTSRAPLPVFTARIAAS